MNREWTECIKQLYSVLDLDKSVVGVNLIKNKETFDKIDAVTLNGAINYCQIVRAATRGNSIKANKETILCRSGVRVMGIDPSDEKNSNGENWVKLGIHKDAEVSQKVRKGLSYLSESNYGVAVSPIEKLNEIPDVVLIITKPYQCMRIVQGYAYHYGMPQNINLIGNQAICLECTARPYKCKDMNISLLCIGTRHRAGWDDSDMAVGIPKEQFLNVVDGLMKTVNAMENDTNKKVIADKLKENEIDFEMRYHYNYYMDC